MNDLNTITRLNNEAVQRDIPRQLEAGKTVVANYAGLHFVGYDTYEGHDAEAQAEARVAELKARNDSSHGKIFRPKTATA